MPCVRHPISPAMADATGHTDVMAPMLESLSHNSEERDPLNRMLYLEGKHFFADHNLNYTDKIGMAAVWRFACHCSTSISWTMRRAFRHP
jgi:hypothetical protein